jgi:hypothetical protein
VYERSARYKAEKIDLNVKTEIRTLLKRIESFTFEENRPRGTGLYNTEL